MIQLEKNITIPDRRLVKPRGNLYPQDHLLPIDYASIAVLDDVYSTGTSVDSLQYFGPGGNFGNIDRFVNTSHTWTPEGPQFLETNNAAIRTSGTADLGTYHVTQFLWFRFPTTSSYLTSSSSVSYAYLTFCNNFVGHSVRLVFDGSAENDNFYCNNGLSTLADTDYALDGPLFDGQWHCVVHSRANNEGYAEVFVDGKLVLYGIDTQTVSADFLCFAGRDDAVNRAGQCDVGFCGYYDRILTLLEARQIYEIGFDAINPNSRYSPILYEPTSEITGDLTAQESGSDVLAATGQVYTTPFLSNPTYLNVGNTTAQIRVTADYP